MPFTDRAAMARDRAARRLRDQRVSAWRSVAGPDPVANPFDLAEYLTDRERREAGRAAAVIGRQWLQLSLGPTVPDADVTARLAGLAVIDRPAVGDPPPPGRQVTSHPAVLRGPTADLSLSVHGEACRSGCAPRERQH